MARIAVKDTNATITRIPNAEFPFIADLDEYVVEYGADWNSLSSTYSGYNITIDDVGFTGKGLRINAALSRTINNVANVTSNDNYVGRSFGEDVYLGPGNDTADGRERGDLIVGGDGDDSLRGGADNDALYGDWANRPNYVGLNFVFPVEDPSVIGDDTLRGDSGNDLLNGGPGEDSLLGGGDNDTLNGDAGNDTLLGEDGDDTLNGGDDDDVLDGGKGPDRLRGQEGGDQLDGGPRGEGFTDILTGGTGADAFYLNYNEAASDNGAGFWEAYVAEYLPGIAGNAVMAGVDALTRAATEKFLGGVGSSILAGGLSTALGGLASEGVNLLFNLNQTNEPEPNGEDVMVVTDFNPTEDALFLPLPRGDAQTLVASAVNFGSSGDNSASGQTGWGIQFTKGTSNTIYAQVFLDPDFLALFNVTSDDARTIAFINEVLSTRLTIGPNGVQQPQNVYPFPTDPADYTGGMLPTIADTPVPFEAPSGTTTAIYGAFGPHIVVDPAVATSGGPSVAGTVMGDLIFITANGFAPQDWDNAELVAQVSQPSTILGFAGDDILNGSSGQDSINGGDGDDFIYGWNTAFAPNVDQLYGGPGDDTLFAAKPAGALARAAANFRGGGDNDTVSFAFSRVSVSANLATGTGRNGNDPFGEAPAYSFSNVENLTGTDFDDTLTGDNNDNILQGNAGNDVLDGRGGNDTISFTNNTGKVFVDLATGTAEEFGAAGSANANTVLFTDTLLNIETAVATPFDDTLTGDDFANRLAGGEGNNTIIGADGNDSITAGDGADDLSGGNGIDTISDSGGRNTITGGNGDDTITAGSGNDSIDAGSGRNSVAAGAGANSITSGSGADTITTGNGNDTIDAGGGNDSVQVAGGNNSINAGSGADTITVGNGQSTIAGGDGDDTVTTGDGNVRLEGDDGDDVLLAGRGRNFLDGGSGNDSLNGGEGTASDTLNGGDGDDTLTTSVSADTLNGGAGDDLLNAGAGFDRLDGGDGDDVLNGEQNRDTLTGGPGNDTLDGGNDRDNLTGGPDDDVLRGGVGDDTLRGGDGVDTLAGGRGSDTLRGGIDNDTVTGDAGNDTFVIAFGEGTDTVTDFQQGVDLIGLADGLTFNDLSFSGSDISDDVETLAILDGIDTTTLSENDFVLV